MTKLEATPGGGEQNGHRSEEIARILQQVKSARNDSQQLNMEFEAYLLDMAAQALCEQLSRRASPRN